MTVELREVAYRYPGYRRPAIERIDLRVADGEIVGVVGPNGAGKSTLCLVASGLAPASTRGELSGEVLIDGVALRGLPVHALPERVGIVFSNPASQRSGIATTVFEEVAIGPINLGCEVADSVARVRAALEAVGIDDLAARSPDRLSGGQAQLVAIASMLAMRPRNLVLDEPVAELDGEGRALVAEALRVIAGQGTAMLIAEHDLDFLRAIGARITHIRAGHVEAAP
jgi:energy-coupling factor transporter ATP-binding protein EcfA2